MACESRKCSATTSFLSAVSVCYVVCRKALAFAEVTDAGKQVVDTHPPSSQTCLYSSQWGWPHTFISVRNTSVVAQPDGMHTCEGGCFVGTVFVMFVSGIHRMLMRNAGLVMMVSS